MLLVWRFAPRESACASQGARTPGTLSGRLGLWGASTQAAGVSEEQREGRIFVSSRSAIS